MGERRRPCRPSTTVLLRCATLGYIGVIVVLQWCYSGVTVVLQWCYGGVTVVSQYGDSADHLLPCD
jgi:hypothetical protein